MESYKKNRMEVRREIQKKYAEYDTATKYKFVAPEESLAAKLANSIIGKVNNSTEAKDPSE